MSEILIVGGHGKVALLLAATLTAHGHTVRSTIRNDAHGADLAAAGATPVRFDLERQDAADLAAVSAGADAVVFSAGGGADGDAGRKRTVDLGGSLMSIEAAGRAGVRRFVQVSAMGVDEPASDDAAPAWRAYVDAKRDADAALRASDLEWTIVRPGRLTDGPATGLIEVGERLPRGAVSRADVADVIAAVLGTDATIGAQFELVAGDRPVREALRRLR